MSLRDARIEDAHGYVLTFWSGEPANEIRRPSRLFDVGPPNEEARRILCASQFGDGVAVHKQACDRDFVAVDQPDFTVRESEPLLLDGNCETTGHGVKRRSMVLPNPDFPPDLLARRREQRRVVGKQRLNYGERDVLNACNQGLVLRLAL